MEQQPPEVLFCDLCNTSVPLQDFDSGAAIRHQGKTIGACCLAALRGGAAESAHAGSEPRRGGHESRVLPLGIALLAAVAAATLFLDFRLDQAEGRWSRSADELAQSIAAQGEVVQGISVGIDGVVRRSDFADLGRRMADLESAQQELGTEMQALGEGHARTVASLQSVRQSVQELDARRPDYGPVLDELRNQLRSQAVALAELLAQPRNASVTPAAVTPEPPAPVAGLSPELSHQVSRLADADVATRFEAVDVLLRSKNPAVLEHLLPMAKDADTFVRRLVVEGLRDFAEREVVDTLLVALADPEEIVADTAWRSLKQLTGQKLPFDASASREAKARAQQKWQEWWEKNRDSFGS